MSQGTTASTCIPATKHPICPSHSLCRIVSHRQAFPPSLLHPPSGASLQHPPLPLNPTELPDPPSNPPSLNNHEDCLNRTQQQPIYKQKSEPSKTFSTFPPLVSGFFYSLDLSIPFPLTFHSQILVPVGHLFCGYTSTGEQHHCCGSPAFPGAIFASILEFKFWAQRVPATAKLSPRQPQQQLLLVS